jgi:TatD DNase family protein
VLISDGERMLIDTHAHLNFAPFFTEPEPYLARAAEADVAAVIVPGIDIASSEKAIHLAEKFAMVFAAVGVHPHDCVDRPENYLKLIESLASHPKVVAIGEIGMDFFRDYAPADLQESTFREQLALAKSLDMPFIMHNRRAESAILKVLTEENYFQGQAHCHTGEADFALNLIAKGMLVSFTGVITFAKNLPSVVAALPLEKLMLETDSPFMAPTPWRGKTCEPFMVKRVAEKMAEIFGKTYEEIVEITGRNGQQFFGLEKFLL